MHRVEFEIKKRTFPILLRSRSPSPYWHWRMRVPKSVLGLENVSSGALLFLGKAERHADGGTPIREGTAWGRQVSFGRRAPPFWQLLDRLTRKKGSARNVSRVHDVWWAPTFINEEILIRGSERRSNCFFFFLLSSNQGLMFRNKHFFKWKWNHEAKWDLFKMKSLHAVCSRLLGCFAHHLDSSMKRKQNFTCSQKRKKKPYSATNPRCWNPTQQYYSTVTIMTFRKNHPRIIQEYSLRPSCCVAALHSGKF